MTTSTVDPLLDIPGRSIAQNSCAQKATAGPPDYGLGTTLFNRGRLVRSTGRDRWIQRSRPTEPEYPNTCNRSDLDNRACCAGGE